jgi:hypothetical protein
VRDADAKFTTTNVDYPFGDTTRAFGPAIFLTSRGPEILPGGSVPRHTDPGVRDLGVSPGGRRVDSFPRALGIKFAS